MCKSVAMMTVAIVDAAAAALALGEGVAEVLQPEVDATQAAGLFGCALLLALLFFIFLLKTLIALSEECC